MATFPTLKTGAVAQYPASKSIHFRNQIIRFVDGTEQRYRDSAGQLYQWDIRLGNLEESEMAAIGQFFVDNQGKFGSFAFTDPWDGQSYPNCSVSSDDLSQTSTAELRSMTTLRIIQHRS